MNRSRRAAGEQRFLERERFRNEPMPANAPAALAIAAAVAILAPLIYALLLATKRL